MGRHTPIWNPARFCYLTAWAITLIEFAITEEHTAPGWIYALYNIVVITGGFLMALIFCSELRTRYDDSSRVCASIEE